MPQFLMAELTNQGGPGQAQRRKRPLSLDFTSSLFQSRRFTDLILLKPERMADEPPRSAGKRNWLATDFGIATAIERRHLI